MLAKIQQTTVEVMIMGIIVGVARSPQAAGDEPGPAFVGDAFPRQLGLTDRAPADSFSAGARCV